jgi:hypothetical protein
VLQQQATITLDATGIQTVDSVKQDAAQAADLSIPFVVAHLEELEMNLDATAGYNIDELIDYLDDCVEL